MVAHKSRSCHLIVYLSFQLLHRGTLIQLVNSATVKQSQSEAMIIMGHCAQRLIVTFAENYDEKTPFRFAKLDTKYGFWKHIL